LDPNQLDQATRRRWEQSGMAINERAGMFRAAEMNFVDYTGEDVILPKV